MTTTLKDSEGLEKVTNPLRQFLIFTIDNEEFGLELRDLQEIITYREVTAIPHAGEDVEGIISLRGKIVTVINGRRRLGREEKPRDGSEKIIVKECDEELRGLIVDDVVQVLRILADQIEPAPPPEKEKYTDTIQEIVNANERMISILDQEKIFHVPE